MAVNYPVILTGEGKSSAFYSNSFGNGELNLLRLSQVGSQARSQFLDELKANLTTQMNSQQTIEAELRGVLGRLGLSLEEIFDARTLGLGEENEKKAHTFYKRLSEEAVLYGKSEETNAQYKEALSQITNVSDKYYRTLSDTFNTLAIATAAVKGKDEKALKTAINKLTTAESNIDATQKAILLSIKNAAKIGKSYEGLSKNMEDLAAAIKQNIDIKMTLTPNANNKGFSVNVVSNKQGEALNELQKSVNALGANVGVKNTSRKAKKGESPSELLIDVTKYMTNLSTKCDATKRVVRKTYESAVASLASLLAGKKISRNMIFNKTRFNSLDTTTKRAIQKARGTANDFTSFMAEKYMEQIGSEAGLIGGEFYFQQLGEGQGSAKGGSFETGHIIMENGNAKLYSAIAQKIGELISFSSTGWGSKTTRVQFPLVGEYEVIYEPDPDGQKQHTKDAIADLAKKSYDKDLRALAEDANKMDEMYDQARANYNTLNQTRQVQDKVDTVMSLYDDNNGESYNIAYSDKFYNTQHDFFNFTNVALISDSNMLDSLDLFTGAVGVEAQTNSLIGMMVNLSSASVLSDANQRDQLSEAVEDMVSTYILQEAFNASNFEETFLGDTNMHQNGKTLYVMNVNNIYAPAWQLMDGVLEQLNHKDVMERVVKAELKFDTTHTGYGLWLESLAAVPAGPNEGSMDAPGSRKAERWNYVSSQVLKETSIKVHLNIAALAQLYKFN